MRPIIGLNCDLALRDSRLKIEHWQCYAQAVERAGGMPILLPPTSDDSLVRAQVSLIGGLVLVGGADYDPKLYGAEPHPKIVPMQTVRAAYDVKLADVAIRRKLPVLAICGGMQLVNIVRGGTLHRHLPEMSGITAEHTGHLYDNAHDITVKTGSLLADVIGESQLTVNSAHHQAVARIGLGLRAAARSTDGVIEALETTQPDEFLLCVQWHPERLIERPQQFALFEALVRASDKVEGYAQKVADQVPERDSLKPTC